jgi:hypothetical protein
VEVLVLVLVVDMVLFLQVCPLLRVLLLFLVVLKLRALVGHPLR